MNVLQFQIRMILLDCFVLHNSLVSVALVFSFESGFNQAATIVFYHCIIPLHFFLPMPFGLFFGDWLAGVVRCIGLIFYVDG